MSSPLQPPMSVIEQEIADCKINICDAEIWIEEIEAELEQAKRQRDRYEADLAMLMRQKDKIQPTLPGVES